MSKIRWFITDESGEPICIYDLDIVACYSDELLTNNWTESSRENLMISLENMMNRFRNERESIDEFDLFMSRVGAILTEENSNEHKLSLIKNLYLKTVWPDKYKGIE